MKKNLNFLIFFLVTIFFVKCDMTLADSSCDKFVTHSGETCNYESSTPGKAICKCLYDLNNNKETTCDNGYTNNIKPNICEASFQTTYFSETQNENSTSNSFIASVKSGNYYSADCTEGTYISKGQVKILNSSTNKQTTVIGCLYRSGISPKATCSRGKIAKINVTTNKGEKVIGDFYICYKNASNDKDDSITLIGDNGFKLEYNHLCESEGFRSTSKIVGIIILIAKWLAPLILIILGMMDFGKAFLSGDEKSLSDATIVFIKRMIIAIIVPFIPGLLFYLVDFFAGDIKDENGESILNSNGEFQYCTDCLKDPLNCNIEYK